MHLPHSAVLDPLFIFTLGMGCSGAAAGTAVAQNVALVPLVLRLHEKVGLKVDAEGLKSTIGSYAASGGYMLVRTVAKILTYTVLLLFPQSHPSQKRDVLNQTSHASTIVGAALEAYLSGRPGP